MTKFNLLFIGINHFYKYTFFVNEKKISYSQLNDDPSQLPLGWLHGDRANILGGLISAWASWCEYLGYGFASKRLIPLDFFWFALG